MDNASKALIIAGAILIAVMLVSLGVMLYNTAAGVAETTVGSVEALGVSGFNAQFEAYLGTGKSKSQVAGLVSKIIANNTNNDIQISVTTKKGAGVTLPNATPLTNITSNSTTAALNKLRNEINAIKNFKYDVTIDATNGYNSDGTIKTITITVVKR